MKFFFLLLPRNRCSPRPVVLKQVSILELKFTWETSINCKSFLSLSNTLSKFLPGILLYLMLSTIASHCSMFWSYKIHELLHLPQRLPVSFNSDKKINDMIQWDKCYYGKMNFMKTASKTNLWDKTTYQRKWNLSWGLKDDCKLTL